MNWHRTLTAYAMSGQVATVRYSNFLTSLWYRTVFMLRQSSAVTGDIFMDNLRFSSIGITARLQSVKPKSSSIDLI